MIEETPPPKDETLRIRELHKANTLFAKLEISGEVDKMTAAVSSKEAAEIRAKLRLRFNITTNMHEVYTTYHKSGIWEWYPVLDHIAQWYKDNFSLVVESYVKPAVKTGGFMEVMNLPPPAASAAPLPEKD